MDGLIPCETNKAEFPSNVKELITPTNICFHISPIFVSHMP